MQVNLFSQAHLTLILLPLLQKTPDSRIVHQSSDLHKGATNSMKFESVAEMNQDIGATLLYNRTKLAQILFLRELYQRIKTGQFGTVTDTTGLPWINATHPGGVSTDQQEQAVEAYGTLGKIGVAAVRPFLKDPVSTDRVQNSYIIPDRKVTEPSQQAMDETLSLNLWKLTKQVLESKIGDLPYTMKAER
jgi:WW domain-containing oxidoreductase